MDRKKLRILQIVICMLLPARLFAADHVWLIGGGQEPDNSQAQIEFNINWVREVVGKKAKDAIIHVYFTDGVVQGRDISEWIPREESLENLQPLARVFNSLESNGLRFRTHQLGDVTGTTERDVLMASLSGDFTALKPGDRALIIYNGHGLRGYDGPPKHTLRLWGDTQISAREFEDLLSKVDELVPVRFIFTQCFSGGFARLVNQNADDTLQLANGRRCGFFAESKDREAEGCSASVKIGDYRDYTTYFFSAIAGETRLGKTVTENIDMDGNGEPSLFDAHLFALAYGYNSDLPRSSSEDYLDRWQPWYLRWVDTYSEPDNVYGKIAKQLADELGLLSVESRIAPAIHTRKKDLSGEMEEYKYEYNANKTKISHAQKTIQQAVKQRWPEAGHPYTKNYLDFLANDLDQAQRYIVGHPEYAGLVDLQNRQTELEPLMLGLERDIAQLDKLLRLRNLARLLDQFNKHASVKSHAAFEQIRSCELQPL